MPPEPYWTDGQCSLFLGDCREILPALGVTADCIIADVPYGETSLPWDKWPEGWLEVAATVTRSLWCFGSLRMYLKHAGEFAGAGWKLSQDVIWEKHNGSGFAADRFRRVHEQPTHWYQGSWSSIYHQVPRVPRQGPKVNGRRLRDDAFAHTGSISGRAYADDGMRLARSVQRVRSAHRQAIHRTEKPPGILEPLITYACPPGGLVVDPSAGSGSALATAASLGRRAIGIELHEPHCEDAAKRLSQQSLFGGEPGAA